MKIDKEAIENIEYLPDSPLIEKVEDEFSHDSIAETMKDIIYKWDCKKIPSLVLGLFGDWGSGKSTIGGFLQKKLKEDQETNIAIAEFDIWKYGADSFRRQFLLHLNSENGLDTKIKKLKMFYQEKAVKRQGDKFKPNKEILYKWGLELFVVSIILILFTVAFAFWGESKLFLKLLSSTSTFFGFGMFSWYFLGKLLTLLSKKAGKDLNSFFLFDQVTTIQHRIEFPEQFEKLFKAMRDKVINRYKKDKVIIIIDNLDRVSDDRVVELLSAIKTFLDRKKVAFIVQCDEEAIKRHLANLYKVGDQINSDSRNYSDEFLRKFFTTSVKIPPFRPADLDVYTKKLLGETKAPFASEPNLILIITSAYRNNPRQIKQFINSFLSCWLLAYKREISDPCILQPPGVVTSYPAMLAKTMVFAKEFPYFFSLLKNEPSYWGEVSENIKKRTDVKLFGGDEDKKTGEEKDIEKRLNNFLIATEYVSTNNIRPFIFLKSSSLDLKIPNSDELKAFLQDNNKEEVVKLIKKLRKEHIRNLGDFILGLLSNHPKSQLRIFNIVNSFLDAKRQEKLSLKNSFFNSLGQFIILNVQNTEGLDVNLIFDEFLPGVSESSIKSKITQNYLELIELAFRNELKIDVDASAFRNDLINQVIKNIESLTNSHISTIRKALSSEVLRSNTEVRRIISTNRSAASKILTPDTVRPLVNGFGGGEEYFRIRSGNKYLFEVVADILLSAKDKINQEIFDLLINKFSQFFSTDEIADFPDFKKLYNNSLRLILTSFPKLAELSEQTSSLAKDLIADFAKDGNFDRRKFYIANLLLLRKYIGENKEEFNQVNGTLNDFWTHAPIETIREMLSGDLLNKQLITEAKDNYLDNFAKRAIAGEDFIQLAFEFFDGEELEIILSEVIKASDRYNLVLSKLKELSNQLKLRRRLADALWTKAETFGKERPEWLGAMKYLVDIKCMDDDFISRIKEILKNLLKEQESSKQDNAIKLIEFFESNKYISKSDVVEILNSSIDFLDAEGSFNLIYRKLLEFVSSRMDLLNTEYQNKVAHLVMVKLVNSNLTDEGANIFLNILETAKLSFEKFEKHYVSFMDILNGVQDLNIRKIFIDKFLQLEEEVKKQKGGSGFIRKLKALNKQTD